MARLRRLIVASGMLLILVLWLVFQALNGISAVQASSKFNNQPLSNGEFRSRGQTTPVTLTLPTVNATVGQTLSVDLMIDTTAATRAAQFGLTFDPAVLRCNSITEGIFYSNWAAANGAITFVFPTPVCDNVNGVVTIMGIIILGGSGGPTGQGVVATYHFTVIGNGVSPLHLTDVIVADDSPEAQPLPTTVIDGEVFVGVTPTSIPSTTITPTLTQTPTPPLTTSPTPTINSTGGPSTTPPPPVVCLAADVNGDGVINVLDLSLVGEKFLQTGSPGWIPEDVIPDGEINVLDLSRVGECQGQYPAGSPTPTDTATFTDTPTTSPATPTPSVTPPTSFPYTPSVSPSVTPTPGDADTIVYVVPPQRVLSIGEPFQVYLMIETIPATRAAQFGLSFDSSVIQCESIQPGTFYSDWAASHGSSTFILPTPTCDNNNGRVTLMGITLLGGTGGPTGKGSLAVITFTGRVAGTSDLNLENVIIADASPVSQALPTKLFNDEVWIGSPSTPTVVPEAILSMDVPIKTLSLNQTLDVFLEIDTVPSSRAAQFSLAFNPEVLSCISITEGTFYSDWAAANGASTFIVPKPVCDNQTGLVTKMGIILLGGRGGPNGSGSLAVFRFKAVGEGTSPLTIGDAVVADTNDPVSALPIALEDGTLTVTSSVGQSVYLPVLFLTSR